MDLNNHDIMKLLNSPEYQNAMKLLNSPECQNAVKLMNSPEYQNAMKLLNSSEYHQAASTAAQIHAELKAMESETRNAEILKTPLIDP